MATYGILRKLGNIKKVALSKINSVQGLKYEISILSLLCNNKACIVQEKHRTCKSLSDTTKSGINTI